MTLNVLLADNVDAATESFFAQRNIQADRKTNLSPEKLQNEIAAYDGLVVRSSTDVTPELLEAAQSLKIVGRAGVGVDNIDIPAATARGVLVMNTPGGNTISTAEHTCGMILALSRNIPQSVNKVKSGGWDRKEYMGAEVYGKSLGIVGLGKVGGEVAERMQQFGMEVQAYDPFLSKEKARQLDIELVGLDELLGTSDYITVHTPLTEKTRDLISINKADKLKKGVRLVNCARGGIYNEQDLPKLIDEGIVSGIALDVYSSEPPDEDLVEILQHPKIISTPHLGASTEEAQQKVARQIANQMADAFEEKSFKGSLNGKSIALTTNREVQPYLELAEKLGSTAIQLAPEHANEFSFEYAGGCARFEEVLTDSILKGMLAENVNEAVNLINARVHAEELGYKIKETTGPGTHTYNDLITVRLDESAPFNKFSAAVFGDGDYRIVGVDGFAIELQLKGEIILYTNIDRPGMLAAVSGALARQEVNIAALSLGRDHKGSNAITAVRVDKKVREKELQPIIDLDGVSSVNYITL